MRQRLIHVHLKLLPTVIYTLLRFPLIQLLLLILFNNPPHHCEWSLLCYVDTNVSVDVFYLLLFNTNSLILSIGVPRNFAFRDGLIS
jgi:hypothetical protein